MIESKHMNLESIVITLAEKTLPQLNDQGYMNGGHNGPYYDPETPVRNTAHWITIFAYCYKKTSNPNYLAAVVKCADYLLSKDARPMGSAFYCRTNPRKDFSNGTIGQAWAIEGLVSAYQVTSDSKYLQTAKEVFLLHPFDENYKLWKVVNVDGSYRGFDMTFNHQLWFAASGYLLLKEIDDEEIRRQCDTFMDNLPNTFKTYKNGLVCHGIINPLKFKERLHNIFDLIMYKLKSFKLNSDRRYKENGYHLFNHFAFALIKNSGYNGDFFQSKQFNQSLQYCFSSELNDWLEYEPIKKDCHLMPKVKNSDINIYGYGYNGPGFELPFIKKVFLKEDAQDDFVTPVTDKQLQYTFNEMDSSFNKNVDDPATLNARLYELVRYLNLKMDE
jgi:hypothetical protein